MSDETRSTRPPLPRDTFRSQRTRAGSFPSAEPLVVTPVYDDATGATAKQSNLEVASDSTAKPQGPWPDQAIETTPERRSKRRAPASPRNPFEAYGERSSSRPYALRLPDAIDLVIRQMAAEERTQPLRVVDRILYDYLKRIGRLPPHRGA